MDLVITTPDFVLPPESDDPDDSFVTAGTSFRMTGLIEGLDESGKLLFSNSLRGAGGASALIQNVEGEREWRVIETFYVFKPLPPTAAFESGMIRSRRWW
jgi:hypothetical protein